MIAINEAIDQGVPEGTVAAMQNPNAMLVQLVPGAARQYHDTLYQAKGQKVANSRKRVRGGRGKNGVPRFQISATGQRLKRKKNWAFKKKKKPRSTKKGRTLAGRWNEITASSLRIAQRCECTSYNFKSREGNTCYFLFQQQMENADAERDIYDELLTQAEIQGNVNNVNGESARGLSVATVPAAQP